jgi:hypothetical protein
MYSREIVFIHNNSLHVSSSHVAIFREVIQRLEDLLSFNPSYYLVEEAT